MLHDIVNIPRIRRDIIAELRALERRVAELPGATPPPADLGSIELGMGGLIQAIAGIEQRIQSLKNELAEGKTAIASANRALAAANEAISGANHALADSHREVSEVNRAIADSNRAIADIRHVIDDLRLRVDNNDALARSARKAMRDQSALKFDLEDVSARVNSIEDRLATVADSLRGLNGFSTRSEAVVHVSEGAVHVNGSSSHAKFHTQPANP